MKRTILVATMFTFITNFAADVQESNKSLAQTSQKTNWSIIETIYNAPNALARSWDTNNNETTQRKMFGFDNYNNCDEHTRTLDCHKYFIQLRQTIPSQTTVNPEMKSQRNKRIKIFLDLADRILDERGQDQIGDSKSLYVIIRIERLLECAPVFGSESLTQALQDYKKHISNNLVPYIPNQTEEQ